MPDDPTQRRIGFNESTFRQVNEAVEAGRGLRGVDELISFVCECGRLGCNRVIQLTVAEYEGVRRSPTRFAIVDGHEIPGAEVVIERTDRWTLVEKLEAGAEVAEETDPRPGDR
ncbi:MAG: hypothetical protein QOG11_352 [Solirubrobacteraceae bacterium]|jgi:hypothetical protein|nr:hypothetical protein [Solirubrobacteraceae bacterium]